MFRRFRIKAALRAVVIPLRTSENVDALIRAEQLFFEPAFEVAPIMHRERWTSDQAMVFMVTSVLAHAEKEGVLSDFADEDPDGYAALRMIEASVLDRARGDPALAMCIVPSSPDHSSPAE